MNVNVTFFQVSKANTRTSFLLSTLSKFLVGIVGCWSCWEHKDKQGYKDGMIFDFGY